MTTTPFDTPPLQLWWGWARSGPRARTRTSSRGRPGHVNAAEDLLRVQFGQRDVGPHEPGWPASGAASYSPWAGRRRIPSRGYKHGREVPLQVLALHEGQLFRP